MWRIHVDHNNCAGTGSCVGLAPEHFTQDAGGRSHPLSTEVTPDELVLDAVALCPTQAITVVDVQTGQPVLP